MENGNALTAFIESTKTTLDSIVVVDYYGQEIPVPLDETIRDIVARFWQATAVEQTRFQQALSHRHRSVLGIFGHRAATIAARQQDADWLKLGLVGTAVANYDIPPKRRVETSLAIFHHVASKLKVNQVDLFEDVAEIAGDDFAEALLKFSRKGVINLTQYGWRELKTPDGVKYKFEWG